MAPQISATEHNEHTPDAGQTHPSTQKHSWTTKLGSSMRDLPEWKYRGKLLRGKTLNTSIAIVANLAFTMFGYDQGVFSGLLTLNDFQRGYPRMAPLEQANDLCWLDSPENTVRDAAQCLGDPTLQAWGVASYQVGCFLALPLIFTWGESWGRRASTFWGCLIMILGTIMQVVGDLAPDPYGILVAGRIIGGIGNGMVTSTIPTWQSECARPEKRGKYITISGAMISGGIAIAVSTLLVLLCFRTVNHQTDSSLLVLDQLRFLLLDGVCAMAVSSYVPVSHYYCRHDWHLLSTRATSLVDESWTP